MEITKTDKARIRNLMQTDHWQGLEALKKLMLAMWREEPVKAEDNFNTTWRTAQREAKVEALEAFFTRAEQEASSV